MSENDTTAQTDDTTADTTSTQDADRKFTQADLDRVVAERVSREKAKYADYADLKKRAAAAMSEQEKALTEAELRGRSAALADVGTRLVKAELLAAAAGQVSQEALDGFLEYADLRRFLGDDGEPDTKAITAAVKRLGAGAPATKNTNFDGGARTSAAKPTDMNALIRHAAGLG